MLQHCRCSQGCAPRGHLQVHCQLGQGRHAVQAVEVSAEQLRACAPGRLVEQRCIGRACRARPERKRCQGALQVRLRTSMRPCRRPFLSLLGAPVVPPLIVHHTSRATGFRHMCTTCPKVCVKDA